MFLERVTKNNFNDVVEWMNVPKIQKFSDSGIFIMNFIEKIIKGKKLEIRRMEKDITEYRNQLSMEYYDLN